jgi:subtilisin family serine protease
VISVAGLAAGAPRPADRGTADPTEEILVPSPRSLASAALAALTVAGLGATASPASAAPPSGASLASYIVTVEPGREAAGVAQRARGLGGEVSHVYTAALNGFAVSLPAAAAAQLSRLPGVAAVEADQAIRISGTQKPATWGLDRIDQGALATAPLDSSYTYSNTGVGVTAYVIDTGIRSSHSEFGGRVKAGYSAVRGKSTTEDCNGHGTHVAGTIGGSTYGVAKQVTLVPVRVLDCYGNGSISGVIAGVDWVTKAHAANTPAVANMSLSGAVSSTLDKAVATSIADGVTYAVAAGNGDATNQPQDACDYSPARVLGALTVGATDDTDAAASFSNYGTCVDLFAPGVDITSAWYTGAAATNKISGTSMATPHVAGVAALYLEDSPEASPTTVAGAILTATTKDAVPTTRTDNNNLLFTAY